ncbi:MAG TPA: pyridoxamine 5'-phosphate oxidase family protein [Solirubrobacterales bacterium]|jgi:PPOX class probable F420-dependent enzyme|nr:pyridoxamine 5'-phosphate oxidase family protein [Solirubrobacterales bacterium]
MNGASPHLTAELAELLGSNKLGTLATVGQDGLPRLSVVYYANLGERIFISTLRERVKAKDIERRGWAALSVRGEEPPYPSATFTGSAVVRSAGIGEDTALVMGRIAGLPEPPEPQSDEALAEAGRVLIEVTVERVSAVTHV